MIRTRPTGPRAGRHDGFRARGHEITRLEGFSDAVFAFAITLLIVSLEVPHSFAELVAAMRGFIGFAICFALFIDVWFEHHRFFRRYGMQDTATILLNAALLFLVLFYVYPLKFLFSVLVDGLTGTGTAAGSQAHPGQLEPAITALQMPWLMVIYGLGFVAVFFVFTLLYRHALRMREVLELDEVEVLLTRSGLQAHLINVAVGVVSVGVAALGIVTSAPSTPFWAGMTYFLLGPAQAIHGTLTRRRRLALERRRDHRGPDPARKEE